MKKALLFFGVLTLLVVISCKKESQKQLAPASPTSSTLPGDTVIPAPQQVNAAIYGNWPENFENGHKSSYAAAVIDLPTGSWNLDDALIGSLDNDRKNGTKSVRIRNSGKLSMQFDLPDGASEVSLKYAVYGSDASSTFELWFSTDAGNSWSLAGNTITANSISLATAVFSLNIKGDVRFEVRKLGGGRLNIDDFTVVNSPAGSVWPENFESSNKPDYSTAIDTFPSGSWTLDDALTGASSDDAKDGAQSIRIENTGKLSMAFDLTGVAHVSLAYANFGADENATWELWYSTNSGSSWQKLDSTVTASSHNLSSISFAIPNADKVRFEIRKISGGRLNIDDINVFGSTTTGTVDTSNDENLVMGNPSDASGNLINSDNYLLEKSQYTLSYNNSKGEANWVSWHLDPSWLGNLPRCNCFSPDFTLPASFFEATTSDYTNTGFDRGHMCPSADRNATATDNSATFLMSNILPQAPRLNEQTWASLEDYCRSLVNSGDELYIIAGGYGEGGSGSNGGLTQTISGGQIAVPAFCWKVIVILPEGDNDLARVSDSTRVIAVEIPNTQDISTNWSIYRTSVDHIEAETGFNFLSNIPDSIQAIIEAQTDNQPI